MSNLTNHIISEKRSRKTTGSLNYLYDANIGEVEETGKGILNPPVRNSEHEAQDLLNPGYIETKVLKVIDSGGNISIDHLFKIAKEAGNTESLIHLRSLEEKHKINITRFIVSMMMRHPDDVRNIRRVSEEAIDKLYCGEGIILDYYTFREIVFINAYERLLNRNTSDLIKVLLTSEFWLIRAEDKLKYITSDKPVSAIKIKKSQAIALIMPISPDLCLLMTIGNEAHKWAHKMTELSIAIMGIRSNLASLRNSRSYVVSNFLMRKTFLLLTMGGTNSYQKVVGSFAKNIIEDHILTPEGLMCLTSQPCQSP